MLDECVDDDFFSARAASRVAAFRMTTHQKQEKALLEALTRSTMPDLHFEMAPRFGVLITHNSKDVGIWSHRNGQFQFRSFADWEPTHFAISIDAAIHETIEIVGGASG